MKKFLICDNLVHPTPILKGWAYGLMDLGYEVDFLPIPQYSILNTSDEYDVLIYPFIEEKHLSMFETYKNLHPNTKIIGCRDEWDPIYLKFRGLIDFFIGALDSTPTVIKDYKENNYEFYNIPLAGNSNLFFKTQEKKIYDSCFIGTLSHGYRNEDKFLYPILNKYNCFLGGMNYGKYNKGFIPYENHNTIRNQSKININFHCDYQILGKGKFLDRNDCNQSVFNIALSGNFQLVDHPLAKQYFGDNVIVAGEDDWLDKFKYYLNHEQEREELANNAMVIAQKEHTWEKRMEQFINILNKHLKHG
jgi:hypothetical protein